MNLFNNYLEALQTKGLYDVEIGDHITIGVEGTRIKHTTTITKIKNDKVSDNAGNIFHMSGLLYRGNTYFTKGSKNKKVYASPKTQNINDKEYKKIKIDFIRSLNWDDYDIKQIEKVLEIIKQELHIDQGNKLIKSRFLK